MSGNQHLKNLQACDKATKQDDDFYLDGVVLNLHAFYFGLERIFEKLATSIDGTVPSAANSSRPATSSVLIRHFPA